MKRRFAKTGDDLHCRTGVSAVQLFHFLEDDLTTTNPACWAADTRRLQYLDDLNDELYKSILARSTIMSKMESMPLDVPPRPSDERAAGSGEPSPDSSFTTRLTPDSDSDDDLDHGTHNGESYKLQSRRKDAEKGVVGHDAFEDDEDEDTLPHERRRASVSTVQSYQLYTPDEERAVVRKFDRKLVLFVALLYMLSFLDRSSTPYLPRVVIVSTNAPQI